MVLAKLNRLNEVSLDNSFKLQIVDLVTVAGNLSKNYVLLAEGKVEKERIES